jgi:hypothetical protein
MDVYKLSTKEVGNLAKNFVSQKLSELGMSTELPKGNKNIVIAKPKSAQPNLHIRVKSRRSGDWQIPTTEGVPLEVKVEAREFWVLVDFTVLGAPEYYVMSGTWLRRKIYNDHQIYLRSHGGTRPESPKSTHNKVTLESVKQWKDRWDILGSI